MINTTSVQFSSVYSYYSEYNALQHTAVEHMQSVDGKGLNGAKVDPIGVDKTVMYKVTRSVGEMN